VCASETSSLKRDRTRFRVGGVAGCFLVMGQILYVMKFQLRFMYCTKNRSETFRSFGVRTCAVVWNSITLDRSCSCVVHWFFEPLEMVDWSFKLYHMLITNPPRKKQISPQLASTLRRYLHVLFGVRSDEAAPKTVNAIAPVSAIF